MEAKIKSIPISSFLLFLFIPFHDIKYAMKISILEPLSHLLLDFLYCRTESNFSRCLKQKKMKEKLFFLCSCNHGTYVSKVGRDGKTSERKNPQENIGVKFFADAIISQQHNVFVVFPRQPHNAIKNGLLLQH